MLQCKCLATLWRIGDLRLCCGAVSCNSTASAVFAWRDIARQSHAKPYVFQIACATHASAVDRSHSPSIGSSSHWFDDELATLDCFRCRRPRAWRDANAMIANLTHPQANMPQDALDDLSVNFWPCAIAVADRSMPINSPCENVSAIEARLVPLKQPHSSTRKRSIGAGTFHKVVPWLQVDWDGTADGRNWDRQLCRRSWVGFRMQYCWIAERAIEFDSGSRAPCK